jgi:hypothetical protein
LSLVTQRRGPHPPFGLAGGAPGALGENLLHRKEGVTERLSGVAERPVAPGDVLELRTPGGGGYGSATRAPHAGTEYRIRSTEYLVRNSSQIARRMTPPILTPTRLRSLVSCFPLPVARRPASRRPSPRIRLPRPRSGRAGAALAALRRCADNRPRSSIRFFSHGHEVRPWHAIGRMTMLLRRSATRR